MKKTEQNRLSMWRAVRLHLDANASIWNSHEPFVNASNALSRAINDAWAAVERQSEGSKGVSSRRNAMEVEAINRVLAIGRLARAFALNTDNHELHHAVNYNRGVLIAKSQTALIATLRSMVNAASPFAEALARYGVAPEAYETALAVIEALQSKQSAVRTAISGRKAVTRSLSSIMKAGTLALAKLDNLVYVFELKHPDFISSYKTARSIVHAGTRHKEDDGSAKAA